MFLGILVANTAIGIAQEVRAKRALARLAALVTPSATVLRDEGPERSRSLRWCLAIWRCSLRATR
ncbi:MAG: cation-transporting P-type ATPase, partial [Solirubrobacteraceae bacterium]|jgi:magnesium-transporting ATPase (P-type)|nr:cation-transporting P-type ATPase [Solirubrobacteraceae bacterium]